MTGELMKRHLLLWLWLLASMGCAGSRSHRAETQPAGKRPLYRCLWTAEAPDIDGRLSDPAWEKAAAAHLAHTVGKPLRQPQRTRVRFLWDDVYFYFGADVEDLDVAASLRGRDVPLWEEEDCLEMFVDPEGEGRVYFEIDFGPAGAVWDGVVLRREASRTVFPDWNPRSLRFKTLRSRQGWTLEGRIRFSALSSAPRRPPFPQDRWRLNVYRIDRSSISSPEVHLSAWSPTRAFHAPANFGELVFLHPARTKKTALCKQAARDFLAARAFEGKSSLAQLLPTLSVTSPGTAYRFDPEKRAWRAAERWGSFGARKSDKAGIPGLLLAHPHSGEAPVTASWRPKQACNLIVLARLNPSGSRRAKTGQADGVAVRIGYTHRNGSASELLRVVDDDWQLVRLAVPQGAKISVTVDPGPAANLSSDGTFLAVYMDSR